MEGTHDVLEGDRGNFKCTHFLYSTYFSQDAFGAPKAISRRMQISSSEGLMAGFL